VKKTDENPKAVDIAAEIDQSSRKMELADPDAGLGGVDRAINRIVEAAGVIALVAIVAVVFANATSRYLLNNSFAWAEEMVQMTIPWLAMTGVFLSIRRGTAIRIDFFFEKLSPGARKIVGKAGYVLSFMVLGLMAYVSYDFVRLFGGDVALYVGLPMGVSTSALVFGAAGAALAFAAAFIGSLRKSASDSGEGRI
jgi:TRAP-type C4-dicarboxylate transport system permease small subunit